MVLDASPGLEASGPQLTRLLSAGISVSGQQCFITGDLVETAVMAD